jgi:hypothetical protein
VPGAAPAAENWEERRAALLRPLLARLHAGAAYGALRWRDDAAEEACGAPGELGAAARQMAEHGRAARRRGRRHLAPRGLALGRARQGRDARASLLPCRLQHPHRRLCRRRRCCCCCCRRRSRRPQHGARLCQAQPCVPSAAPGAARSPAPRAVFEPLVYLRGQSATGEDARGRRRQVDFEAPPAQLRGLLVLTLPRPSRIKEISVELRGTARTDWPEGACAASGRGPAWVHKGSLGL